MIDSQLWQAYSNPFFRFSKVPQGSSFAIITAWNPASVWLSQEENDRNNQHLAQDIDHTYFSMVDVGDESFSWVETSFAVEMTLQRSLELGKKYGQNAIYFIEGERLFLISCDKEQTKVSLGNWRDRCR
ncbi:DUF3293 domain-containing protein [Vibrio sp. RE86]|uniref:DUF3293 domain-containing protein n=1 Tax=Vibrio sp. RE86 TaxID=2607605 RepID=UPI001493D652|nr:DUF3293 domain-containing protein [Vibrio sp. RE86]NOH80589.1 DUF3293 domain-containing protein [Vibrio sp. RE86]